MGGRDKPQTHPSGWARAPGAPRKLRELQGEPQECCRARTRRAGPGPTPPPPAEAHAHGTQAGAGAQACDCHRGPEAEQQTHYGRGHTSAGEAAASVPTRHVQLAEHTRGLTAVIQLALQLNERKGVCEATGKHTEAQVRPRSPTQTWGRRERGCGAWVVSTVRGRAWRGTSHTHTHSTPQGSAESKASSLNSSNDLTLPTAPGTCRPGGLRTPLLCWTLGHRAVCPDVSGTTAPTPRAPSPSPTRPHPGYCLLGTAILSPSTTLDRTSTIPRRDQPARHTHSGPPSLTSPPSSSDNTPQGPLALGVKANGRVPPS